ncbi:MAG: hypothetical protein II857_01125 [Selenomonadaceae bacterium]|nr:hypothetical protein [Selenomonadaceae bacterium]
MFRRAIILSKSPTEFVAGLIFFCGEIFIGVKRRTELFKKFGTIGKIKSATVEELSAVPSMNRAAAEALKEFFDAQSS